MTARQKATTNKGRINTKIKCTVVFEEGKEPVTISNNPIVQRQDYSKKYQATSDSKRAGLFVSIPRTYSLE